MHYRGTIWRPPFESNSALLQITSGCTHHSCKFCSLYNVDFRMSPIKEIEEDLRELSKLMPNAKRVFMTGANPMVLPFEKLKDLFELIHQYLPNVKSIGGRITDLVPKSTSELRELHYLGLDGISIGTETGDDDVLSYMNKGNTASQTIKQCKKLDTVGIGYHMVANGKFIPAGEKERISELQTLIGNLQIRVHILANTVSNFYPFKRIYLMNEKRQLKNCKMF